MLNELAYYARSSLSSGIFEVPTNRQNKFLPKSVKSSWTDRCLRWSKSSTLYFRDGLWLHHHSSDIPPTCL